MHGQNTPPGWYGKLSMLGDFASRRFDADWVRSCDEWLSQGVRSGQQALGTQWTAAYLAAPVWRFAWAPGAVDRHWWFGVLMPSCDNVGRYYPLLIAQVRQHPPIDRFGLEHLEAWWSGLARAGLATLAVGATLDGFEDALLHAPPWPSAAHGPWLRAHPDGEAGHWQVAPGAGLTEVAGSLAAQTVLLRLGRGTLWWPVSAPGTAGQLWQLPGLPLPEQLARMLTSHR